MCGFWIPGTEESSSTNPRFVSVTISPLGECVFMLFSCNTALVGIGSSGNVAVVSGLRTMATIATGNHLLRESIRICCYALKNSQPLEGECVCTTSPCERSVEEEQTGRMYFSPCKEVIQQARRAKRGDYGAMDSRVE